MGHRQSSSQLHIPVGGILTGHLHRAFTLRIVVELVVIVGVVVAAVVVGDGGWLGLTEASLVGGGFARRGDNRVH